MEGAVQEQAQAVSGWSQDDRDTWIRNEKGQSFRGLCIFLIRAGCLESKTYCPKALDARLESG